MICIYNSVYSNLTKLTSSVSPVLAAGENRDPPSSSPDFQLSQNSRNSIQNSLWLNSHPTSHSPSSMSNQTPLKETWKRTPLALKARTTTGKSTSQNMIYLEFTSFEARPPPLFKAL